MTEEIGKNHIDQNIHLPKANRVFKSLSCGLGIVQNSDREDFSWSDKQNSQTHITKDSPGLTGSYIEALKDENNKQINSKMNSLNSAHNTISRKSLAHEFSVKKAKPYVYTIKNRLISHLLDLTLLVFFLICSITVLSYFSTINFQNSWQGFFVAKQIRNFNVFRGIEIIALLYAIFLIYFLSFKIIVRKTIGQIIIEYLNT